MYTFLPELKTEDEHAGTAFRNWLDRSGVAYMYGQQSPLTVPGRQRERFKRPDYLVGVPHAGMLAFDVKAKSSNDNYFTFELDEVRKAARFARVFNLTAYFACIDVEQPECHWWVELSALLTRVPEQHGEGSVVTFGVDEAYEIDLQLSFLEVVMQYNSYAMNHGLNNGKAA